MKIVLRKHDPSDDWYTIEKAKYKGKAHIVETGPNSATCVDPARISDACVEGTKEQMIAIAKAIKDRTGIEFKRCAVLVDTKYKAAHFWSPRNSAAPGAVPLPDADEFATDVLAELGESK